MFVEISCFDVNEVVIFDPSAAGWFQGRLHLRSQHLVGSERMTSANAWAGVRQSRHSRGLLLRRFSMAMEDVPKRGVTGEGPERSSIHQLSA